MPFEPFPILGSIKIISVLSSVMIILSLLENDLGSRRRDVSEGEMLQKIVERDNSLFCYSHLLICSALLLLHTSFAGCMTAYKIVSLMTILSLHTLPFLDPETPAIPDVEES